MSDPPSRRSIADAQKLVAQILCANQVTDSNAKSVARAVVAAEVDGQVGHGFTRVAAYAAQAKVGKINGAAVPTAQPQGAAYVQIDAGSGFAYPAIDLMIEQLVALAEHTGIAAAGIRRSHHCGQLGTHVERLAQRGLLALMVANTPKAMAPWGGNRPCFGTNPIAFAAPRRTDLPLVIDLSLSKVARGKVMAASKRGDAIPTGWALDAQGKPTTDPQAALQGTMLPAGDAKGAALALMVEVLAATLTGANYSFEASSFLNAQGAAPDVGQFVFVANPQVVTGAGFTDRLEQLVAEIAAQDGCRLPGSQRKQMRESCAQNGLVVPDYLLEELTLPS